MGGAAAHTRAGGADISGAHAACSQPAPFANKACQHDISTLCLTMLTRLYALTTGCAAAWGAAPCGDSSEALGNLRLARTAWGSGAARGGKSAAGVD